MKATVSVHDNSSAADGTGRPAGKESTTHGSNAERFRSGCRDRGEDPRGQDLARHRVRFHANQGPSSSTTPTAPSPPATTIGPAIWRTACGATRSRRSGRGCKPPTPRCPTTVEAAYGEKLTRIGHIGFSAMMHGYLAFDKDGELLVPFRTWQNTNTHEAHEKLSELFPVQHSGALVHRPPVPVRAQQRGARLQGRVLHHAGRLRALEAHRQEGARRGRRLGHVPHRP